MVAVITEQLTSASLINRAFQRTAQRFQVQDTALVAEVVILRAAGLTRSRPTNSQVGKFRHGDRRIVSKSLEALLVAMARIENSSIDYFLKDLEAAVTGLYGQVYHRKIVNFAKITRAEEAEAAYGVSMPRSVSETTRAFLHTMQHHGISFSKVEDISRILYRASIIPVKVSVESLRKYGTAETDPTVHSLEALLLIFAAYGAVPTCLKDMRRRISHAYGLGLEEPMTALASLLEAVRQREGFERSLGGYGEMIQKFVWSVESTLAISPTDLMDVAEGRLVSSDNTFAALAVLLKKAGQGTYTESQLRAMQDGGTANGATAAAPHSS